MKASEIQEAVKKVMGEDPVEMVVRYYEGLIQISADRVAEELKTIEHLKQEIKRLEEL